MLLRGWRYALIGIVIFSAVLTPPDVISQLIMAGPVMVLYISSVLISMAVTRKRRKEKSDEE
jgi:sec-independent protein translocase protein TatC